MRTAARFLAAALACTVVGCGGKKTENPSPGVRETRAPGSQREPTSPPSTAPASKGINISKFRLGYGFGADGAVNVDGATFAQGESAFVSFDVNNAPSGSKVRVAWNQQPSNKTLAQEEAAVSSSNPSVAFKAPTSGWPLGEYVLQIFLVAPGSDAASIGVAKLKIVKDRPK